VGPLAAHFALLPPKLFLQSREISKIQGNSEIDVAGFELVIGEVDLIGDRANYHKFGIHSLAEFVKGS
jgi:hypothetical protein